MLAYQKFNLIAKYAQGINIEFYLNEIHVSVINNNLFIHK